MKETKRITKLFEDQYNGNPWIDVTIMGALRNITSEQASKKIAPGRNSIWQIVNHIISWRENVLLRVQGNIITTPNNNYFSEIADTSETAWQKALERLENSQHQWVAFLKTFDETRFEKIYPKNRMSYYEHIHGILQHDAYHLGQIVLLSKLI
ncbi:MAG TPA: DinB family protein [Hanamia sp.]|nr:DinB family protein [Hanamia sp.]